MGRLIALSIVAAAVFLQTLSALPNHWWVFALTAVIGLSWITLFGLSQLRVLSLPRWILRVFILAFFFMLSFAWSGWRAQLRLYDRLSIEQENVVTRLSFMVVGLVQDQGDSLRFEAIVQPEGPVGALPPGIPKHIQVVWRKQDTHQSSLQVRPGQTWRAALIFKRPRGALNPHGFDYEAHLLSRNIRAIGRVRGRPVLLSEHAFSSMQVLVSLARQYLRSEMRKHVGEMTYGAVLIALAIGDQDSVKSEHWEVFNKTGITHLVSISGSHVTMLAAFGGLSMLWLWKRLRWRDRALGERVPAKVMAAGAALSVAWLYCLLAGWGVPARRTFFMLLVSGLAMMTRLPISASSVLCLAAAVVTVIDPWSPISTGFWLSFGAVAILFYVSDQSQAMHAESLSLGQRGWQILKDSARLQWIITLAMLPALAFLFQQISVSSPLANAVAIPIVTFVVTPLALVTAVISCVPGLSILAGAMAWCGHVAFDACMVPITWLANASWSSLSVAAMPVWCLVLSVLGICWALQPPGIPARWAGWSLLLPALSWQPQRVPEGGWWLTALDVGQGGAILVGTKHHVLLFDSGPRLGTSDAGKRVVAPVLRALGLRKIDALIVSHSDMDHAGGLPGLLQEVPVAHAFSSFNLEDFLSHLQKTLQTRTPFPRPSLMSACEAGYTWAWDGVVFSFMHPVKETATRPLHLKALQNDKKIRKNDQSCVLHIRGNHHSALLAGDIGVKQELEILQRIGSGQAQHSAFADVVLVGHHGSTTSSSPIFVLRSRAKHAIAQAGYLNRFSHPALEVEERWKASQAKFWRTDNHGAVTVKSTQQGLNVEAESQFRKRYWHDRID
jgi:competence protein ComEC